MLVEDPVFKRGYWILDVGYLVLDVPIPQSAIRNPQSPIPILVE